MLWRNWAVRHKRRRPASGPVSREKPCLCARWPRLSKFRYWVFGWQVVEDGALIEVPEQQALIRQIFELRRQSRSLRALAAKTGGTVSHVTVRSVLANAHAQIVAEVTQ